MNQPKNFFSPPNPDAKCDAPAPHQQPNGEFPPDGSDSVSEGVPQRNAVFNIPEPDGKLLDVSYQVFPEDAAGHSLEELGDSPGKFSSIRQLGILVACLLTIVAAGSFLFLCSQTAILLREISSWIGPARYAGFIAIVALWGAVLVAAGQLFVQLVWLKRSPNLSLAALRRMQDRDLSRERSIVSQKAAEDTLREFITDYPRDKKQVDLLRRAQLDQSPDAPDSLFTRMDDLSRVDDGVSSTWLERARSDVFQSLDDAADRLIRDYGVKVGVATAVSPRGAIDSLVMFAGLYKLVGDLCQLYSVRPSGFDTLIILCKSLMASAFAYGADTAGDKAAQTYRDLLAENIGAAGAAVTAKVVTRGGEGIFNGTFVWRIGQRLKTRLRPLGD